MTMAFAIPDCFDAVAVRELRDIFGEAEFEGLLTTLLAELDVRPGLIADLVSCGDHEGARAAAHRFRGGAVYFGRMPVVELAQRIEAGPERALPALASQLVATARDLSQAIRTSCGPDSRT